MSKQGKILIIDDQVQILQSLEILLRNEFAAIRTLDAPDKLMTELNIFRPEVILLDMNFNNPRNTGEEGIYWLKEILKQDPAAIVIMITAFAEISLAVKAIRDGATDFISKPWDPDKLIVSLHNAVELRYSRDSVKDLKNKQHLLRRDMDGRYPLIKGPSSSMKEVYNAIEKVAGTEANILILGENGTGKEVIAREIHRLSLRTQGIFLGVDLGALPESLFESELFGYVKGSFTDAREDRAGRFEAASGGTLFLDEIGNLNPSQQMKLLTALQNREITRLGSNKPVSVDIRLISATNKNLEQMVSEGDFREDLFYRLNTIIITLPPLRERKDDIPLLAKHFLEQFSGRYNKDALSIGSSGMEELINYSWPGNVRELKHAIEKAVILNDQGPIDSFQLRGKKEAIFTGTRETRTLDELEKEAIRQAMNSCRGNMSLAARQLGISRTTLYTKIQKFNL